MKKVLIPVTMLFILTSLSFSWEKGSVGLNMRVDPSPRIGMTFHISEKFAIRPYIGFSIGSEESESEFQPRIDLPVIKGKREEDSTSVNFGLGFLFNFLSAQDFSLYTGLNFGYSRVNREISFSWRDGNLEETGETLQANALLGLHCQVMKNLGIFGEIGFGYTYGKFDSENGVETDVNTRRWGLANSGVGIVFYF